MVLLSSSPRNRLLSQAIIVLALATQVLPAPYTVIANVQRHVVSSGGNTVHFPAQVTIHCPDYFGLRCRHQVNGQQVVINIFHGNPNHEGNAVVKSVIITGEGRVETSEDTQPHSPTYSNTHDTEASTSKEDSAMNDVSSGESFNGKGEQEPNILQSEESAEITTEKDNDDGGHGGFFGALWGKSRDHDSEESQTEDNWTRNYEETETEKPSNEEQWGSRNRNGVEEDEPDLVPDVATDYDYDKYLENENSREKSQNNDDDETTELNDASTKYLYENEVSKDDSEGDMPKADRFTIDEVTTYAPNSVEVTTSNALLTGKWRFLGWK